MGGFFYCAATDFPTVTSPLFIPQASTFVSLVSLYAAA
jgi:hypothetical protein